MVLINTREDYLFIARKAIEKGFSNKEELGKSAYLVGNESHLDKIWQEVEILKRQNDESKSNIEQP